MKRQIIKTRPVQPYRIARIAIVIAIVAASFVLGYLAFAPRVRGGHAGLAPRTTVRQDLAIFSMNSRSPALLS